MSNPLRELPAVHQVLAHSILLPLLQIHGQAATTAAVREHLEEVRQGLRSGQGATESPSLEVLARKVAERLLAQTQPRLRAVINATGIVLHTNLGRAPLAESAAQAAADAGRGYLNLELDLGTGKRSSRQDAVRDWICQLLGSESATVVNNNAAATVIALRALAANREVIVSRGELVEIGGSFRIPDIMGVSGALLREVGTTNMTRIRDYERALSANTAALLRVHCSNYRIHGHTESASIDELSALAKKHHLLLIDDIGSGALIDYVRWGLTGEPLAHASLQAGADLVLFSGDKLLGGPQAGILAGRADLIQKIEKDPLMRAFRLDKMSLAALEATLRIYLNPQRALQEIPVLRMLEQSQATLRERAERLADRLRALPQIAIVEACEDSTYVGGGSLPDKQMQTMIVRLKSRSGGETEFARRLRLGVPAVMARIQEGWLILDLRTIFPNQEESLLEAVAACS